MKNEEMTPTMAIVDRMRHNLDRISADLETKDQKKEARMAIAYLSRLLGKLDDEEIRI